MFIRQHVLASLAVFFGVALTALPAEAQVFRSPEVAAHYAAAHPTGAAHPATYEAAAADPINLDQPVGMQGGPYGIGMGSSWPAYGVSGTYRVNEKITAELILGLLGTVQSVAGRGWYRFRPDPTYELYGFATVGMYRYDYSFLNETESVFGIGGGIGADVSLAKLLDKPDFPPLYWNVDVGLVLANFEYYNFSALSVGGGLHYRF